MSVNKLISIKNPIIDALELCGCDQEKDFPVFMRWAILAEKDISSYYQYTRKIVVLDIKHCTAELPCDAYSVQRAILGDLGCNCGDLFQRWCSWMQVSETTVAADQSFLVVDIGGDESCSVFNIPVSCEIQDNKLVFAQDLDAQKVTVQYLAYNMDCDGFLEISENHVQAITFACCYKFYLRKKRSSNEDFYKINHYFKEWNRECANARAKDAVLTESDRNYIVAMTHDPMVGIGLSLGMRTTLGTYYW